MKPVLLKLLTLCLCGQYVLAYIIWYVTLCDSLFFYGEELLAFQVRFCPIELVIYILSCRIYYEAYCETVKESKQKHFFLSRDDMHNYILI
jgi:hypothetical protein